MDILEKLKENSQGTTVLGQIYVHQSKENGPITLRIYSVDELENSDLQELFKSYGHLISYAYLNVNHFSKSELEKVKAFLDKSQLKHIIIDASFCTHKSNDLLNMDTFEKVCKLNERTNGMCHFKINKSGSKDIVTIDKIYLRDASDFDTIQLEDSEVDRDCIVSLPNREFDIKPLEESWDESKSRDNYKFDTFTEIMKKLHELIDDIEPDIPDLKKFAIIYDRVGRYISYDNASLESSKADDNFRKCRNLENGLLKGRCVCEGYAEILMNALRMVGIKSDMVLGFIGIRTEELNIRGFQEYKDTKGEIVIYDGINKKGKHIAYKKVKNDIWKMMEKTDENVYDLKDAHAWNIVTIDEKVFYVDVTWDSGIIKSNHIFQHIQSQDEIEQDKKVLFQNSPYKVEGLSEVEKEELVAYQFELGHEREFERKIQIEKNFNNMSLESCLYMMNTSLYDANGKFTFTQKMLETLVANYSLENVIKACHKINNVQLESRINELFKKRPSKLPYSNKRIAEGVTAASYTADQLLIEANSKEEDINIEQ